MNTIESTMLTPTLETLSTQAQVFASAWALVGSRFDSGEGLEMAEVERGILLDMARSLYAENAKLQARVNELDALCDKTYVAEGADAYHYACEMMERHQQEREAAGKVVGTENSLCDGISWLYGHIAELEAQLEAAGAGGVGPMMGNGALMNEGTMPAAQPVAVVTGKLGDICSFRSTAARKGDAVYLQPAAQAQEDAVAQAAAAEREACVAACEKVMKRAKDTASSRFVTDIGKVVHNAMAAGAHNCIAAITGRDQHAPQRRLHGLD